MKKFLLVYLVVCVAAIFPQDMDDWKLSGQIQLRTELDGRDFYNDTYPLSYTSLRTRLGVQKNISGMLGFFVQFSDSRVFGEEPNTLAPINNIDLHQGYITLTKPLDLPFNLQAGRFEMLYGTERFIGPVGWHYVGRSFDGARLNFNIYNNITFDIFAVTLREFTNYIANAVPSVYPINSDPARSMSLYGFWKKLEFTKDHRFDGFGYFELDRTNTDQGDNQLERFTIGLNHVGKYDQLSSLLEAAYQGGSTGDIDISAYLVSLQLFYTAGISKFGIGADLLSGTKYDSDKINSFTPAFGTNHKFYGFMDYFINIPANTRNLGLNDFYLSAAIQPQQSKFSGSIVAHHFMSNVDPADDRESVFGQEIDLTIKYDFIKGTAISWGGSLFFPGDLMKSIFRSGNTEREDTAFWTYLMITANL